MFIENNFLLHIRCDSLSLPIIVDREHNIKIMPQYVEVHKLLYTIIRMHKQYLHLMRIDNYVLYMRSYDMSDMFVRLYRIRFKRKYDTLSLI